MSKRPRIFLSYAHVDNKHQDFTWVVQQLERAGADVEFDDRVLVVGQRLWPQIEARILDPSLRGWGILLTPQSVESQACMEELEYARTRALNQRDWRFPLIGMVHEVPAAEIPLAIRARLYVSMRDPDWAQRVVAGLRQHAFRRDHAELGQFRWRVHRNYAGDPECVAIEAQPRFSSVYHFAVATPVPKPELVGVGPPDGGGVSGPTFELALFETELKGEKCHVESMRGPLDPGASAYAVFRGRVPRWVGIGATKGWGSPPTHFEVFEIEGTSM